MDTCRYFDEEMTPIDTPMPMKVKNKVTSFPCLHNDINKNLMLLNLVSFNIHRNNDVVVVDDDVNFRETLSVVFATDGTWIHHAQDQSWSASSSKPNL